MMSEAEVKASVEQQINDGRKMVTEKNLDAIHVLENAFQRALQTKVRTGCCRLSKISLPKMSADLF